MSKIRTVMGSALTLTLMVLIIGCFPPGTTSNSSVNPNSAVVSRTAGSDTQLIITVGWDEPDNPIFGSSPFTISAIDSPVAGETSQLIRYNVFIPSTVPDGNYVVPITFGTNPSLQFVVYLQTTSTGGTTGGTTGGSTGTTGSTGGTTGGNVFDFNEASFQSTWAFDSDSNATAYANGVTTSSNGHPPTCADFTLNIYSSGTPTRLFGYGNITAPSYEPVTYGPGTAIDVSADYLLSISAGSQVYLRAYVKQYDEHFFGPIMAISGGSWQVAAWSGLLPSSFYKLTPQTTLDSGSHPDFNSPFQVGICVYQEASVDASSRVFIDNFHAGVHYP